MNDCVLITVLFALGEIDMKGSVNPVQAQSLNQTPSVEFFCNLLPSRGSFYYFSPTDHN